MDTLVCIFPYMHVCVCEVYVQTCVHVCTRMCVHWTNVNMGFLEHTTLPAAPPSGSSAPPSPLAHWMHLGVFLFHRFHFQAIHSPSLLPKTLQL